MKRFRIRMVAAVLSLAFIQVSSMGSFAAAAAGTPAEPSPATKVQVTQFRFLDKELDRISLNTTSKPDGTRDGHLSLLLDAGNGAEIQTITMKTADAQGKDTNHGVWKTWKAETGDIGNLLAVVKDGKILNTGYQQTLGTLKGIHQLELYASDNNGMKPGENYYLEIVTSSGTVKSEITPFAENKVSYAPVSIREFRPLDLDADRTSIAEFKPDGRNDGHFRLKLHFAQKTGVLAVILRSSDKEGKDGYQGIWRTNRAGTGWLLGIAQGDTIIKEAFSKDVKEPVGEFRGSVVWDLYANNNGSIKNGQYYTIEVETAYGTVISKPVQFGDPSSAYINNEPLGFKTIGLTLNSTSAVIDEQEHTLEVAPFTLEGRTLVPIRFIGEALGAKVDWNGQQRRVTLEKAASKVELTIDQKEAYVNGALTVLVSPAVIRDGITLVPVRFISESMNMKVFFDDGEIVITDAIEQK